jgi:two-component system cell cycle sensor histidine kinase/response regulator CckA
MSDASDLRSRAEARVSQRVREIEGLSPAQIAATVYELEVHQVELELQNEALRQTQQELEAARDRFRDLFDFAPVGCVTLDAEGRIVEANLRAARLCGVSRAALIGQRLHYFIAPEAQDRLYLYRRAVQQGSGGSCVLQLHSAAGATVDVAVESAPVGSQGDPSLWRMTLTDLSTRMHAERKLQELHRQLEAEVIARTAEFRRMHRVFMSIADPIVIKDVEGRILEVNQEAEEFYGWRREELVGRSAQVLMPPEAWADWSQLAERCLRGEPVRDVEGVRVHRSGERLPVLASMARLPSAEGWPVLIASGAKDIRRLKRVEVELREALDRTRAILEAALDGIAILDESGQIESVNPAVERMFGWKASELKGQKLPLLVQPPAAAPDQSLYSYLQTAEHGMVRSAREVEGVQRDGTRFPADLGISEIHLGERQWSTVTIRDLSERKRFERELSQAQKMHAVGQLAAGVAHDFNNILAAICGSAEILLADLPDSGRDHRAAKRTLAATLRGSALTQRLLSLGKLQPGEPRALDLDQEVVGVVDLARQLVGEDISIELALESVPYRVIIDPVQAGQVLMNLIVNARDAMPRGGQIRVETVKRDLDSAAAARLGVASGPIVRFSVEDNGSGIPLEIQGRIFEPFFTTKETGKGTGLGLSTIYGIVKQCGGTITVDSEPGRGSRFDIYLPAHDVGRAPVEAAAEAEAALRDTVRGSGKILVVEDDSSLRELLGEILRMHGYSVREACSPKEALEFAAESSRLDGVISDVVMPGMSGIDLAVQLRKQRPELPVLLMSGYTGTQLQEKGLLQTRQQLIAKPFSAAELTRKLAAMLAPARARDGAEPERAAD